MATKNLKVLMSGDTKPYREEVDKATVSTNKFKNDAGGAMNDVAAAFGVNIGQIKGQLSIFSNAFTALFANLKQSAVGASVFSSAMNIVKVAMVSTGIMALVVGIGALVAYFTQTERGAEAIERGMARLKAVFRELTDRASALGEGIVNAFENPKEAIKDLWEFVKSQFVNRFTAIPLLIQSAFNIVKGIFKGGAGDAAKDFASALTQMSTGLDKVQQNKVGAYLKEVSTAMKDEANAAADLTKQYQDLEDQERSLRLVNTERRSQASELREQAMFSETTAQKKRELLLKAMALEKLAYSEELVIAKGYEDIHKKKIELGEIRDEDLDKSAELHEKVNNIIRDSANTQRTYEKQLKGANKAIEEQVDSEKKALQELKNMKIDVTVDTKVEVRVSDEEIKKAQTETNDLFEKGLKNGSMTVVVDAVYRMPTLPTHLKDDNGGKNTEAEIKEHTTAMKRWKETQQAIGDTKSQYLDISSAVQEAAATIAVGTGEMLGNLLSGQGGLQSFGDVVSGAFANLALTVGKQMIQFGMSGIALQKLLISPWGAVAAGVALVALGTMAKNAISKTVSSGGGGDSSGGQNFNFDTRSSLPSLQTQRMAIEVTGKLSADGKGLSAALTRENTRVSLAT